MRPTEFLGPGCPSGTERSDPPGYVAVGEAYLDGFMYGKAIKIMEKGELRA
jgi:hypothetical protein